MLRFQCKRAEGGEDRISTEAYLRSNLNSNCMQNLENCDGHVVHRNGDDTSQCQDPKNIKEELKRLELKEEL